MSTSYTQVTRVNSSGSTVTEITVTEHSSKLDLTAYARDPETGDDLASVSLLDSGTPESVVDVAIRLIDAAIYNSTDAAALEARVKNAMTRARSGW